ncbi:hypothetical protein SAE02_40450 [Skermanella aerolata]|uniref:SGNH hydrolase-type esterase domain-containing protein n=1 Tax=Skermanella aerolata TaxID=393310 RepID=A0A512DTY0_9PROT|nr:SGNH/GDSL hydrolase family protein [Skermanella aerolata]KJB92040.1 lipase [Skermanella aerolata KACC 11604]GEO39897.1 hypothetical protein SAE02_40450 [Skermanella aerolata]
MSHLILLGDSIFDNAAYVAGGPDVVRQVRDRLPPGWTATLRAVDGSVTDRVERQLGRLPADAGYLVVSVGGNDALGYASTLEAGVHSVAEAVDRLATVRERFGEDYETMLDRVLEHGLPTAVCTIHDTRIPPPRWRLVVTALSVFNDCITRSAFSRSLPVIDLRLICDRDEDYANPIEPSVRSGEKIAAAIAGLVISPPGERSRSVIIA